MAPIRKFSNLNKLSFKDNKESPTKDAHNEDASSQQKRKTTDLSGPQWSKEELGRFYDAYRKYGKNWKKVAGIVRGRSVEMVEALYNVNRAYLSLPDGAASVAGLIAMMTDHYSTLDSDESGRECNEQPKISRKAQKRDRGKSRGNMSKSTAGHVPHKLQSQAVASNYGCLSLLKSSGPRIVGKRTPRISISHPYSKGDLQKHLSPSKHDPSSEEDVNADEIAEGELSLAKVLQGESSSHTSNRRVKLTRMSPVRGCGKIYAEAVMFGDKHIGAAKEDWGKGKLGMRVTGNADLTEDGVNTVEVCRKRKKFHNSKTNLQDSRYPSAARDSCRIKKRRKQILSEDEYTAMDVLSILKDLPSKLEPTSTMESGPKENGDKHAMDGEDSDLDVGLTPEAKQQMHQSTSIMNRRKRKTLSSKIPKAEPEMNSLHSKQKRTEIPKSDSLVSCRLSEQQITEQKPVGPQKSASQKDDFLGQGNHLASSTVQAPIADQIKLQTKQRSRRKMLPQKMLIPNSSENIGNGQFKKSPSSLLKEKLSNCLSSGTLQRWCAFEWFYSAIDYPWFAEREFVEYLNHVGLGHVPKLTRVEWGVIRSSLGKPRRLSQQFLKEEKDKLERYRESVRNHYAELRSGITEAIPSDLARPLRVGQRVIARHPKTRGIYDGSILTVECNKCRVQFDRLELGVELVMDIDCMPLNLVDNMPEALRKERIPVDKDQRKFNESINPKVAGHMKYASSENLESADGSPLISSPAHPVNTFLKPTKGDTSGDKALTSTSDKAQGITQRQSSNLLQIHSRDTDIRALADLKCALDKKEMLVLELKYMNCEVLKNQNDGDESLKTSEHFKMQYASVLLQLKEVNDQASSALLYMRQRNTFQENSSRPWLKPMGKSSNPTEEDFASLAQESGSNVVEVVESSRWKAQKMVDVAAEAVSSLKHGEDVYKKIGEALDYTNGQDFGVDSMPPMRSNTSNQGDHDLPCPNQGTSGMAEQRTTDQTSVSMLNNPTEVTKVEIPSALISSCVATLLMIQRCTDRQCPPGEAVQILDSALTSLQPCCSQNLPIYRDIQMCMGMVKNQILALIPT